VAAQRTPDVQPYPLRESIIAATSRSSSVGGEDVLHKCGSMTAPVVRCCFSVPVRTGPARYPRMTMTTSNQPSDSFLEAMKEARIPAENHEFIRRITTAIGIAEYRAVENSSKSYVIARRRDGLPDLHIAYGYTNGFVSEEEIIHTTGSATGRAPSSRKGTWYVEHPTTRVRPGGERSRDTRREAGFCGCGMQLSLTGVCANCD